MTVRRQSLVWLAMMLQDPAFPWIALGLALTLAPVYGLHADVDRNRDADVVDGAQAYVGKDVHEPTLNASNGYEDDALTITHRHVDAVTLEGSVNNTATDPRFTFPNTPFTLEPGASLAVSIQDTDEEHPSGTYTVDVQVQIDVEEGDEQTGRQTMQRTLTVVVE